MIERFRRSVFFLFWALPLLTCGNLWAQDDDDDDDEFVKLPPGIAAAYAAPDGKPLLQRIEPAARLWGGSPHSKVPAGRFRATWKGCLLVPYDGKYTFWLDRSTLQEAKFTIAGRPVEQGKPMELGFGNLPLEISGLSGGDRPGVQLMWENDGFAREVIPARFFGHLPDVAQKPEIVRQALEDSGAALAESFGCFRCHEGPPGWTRSLGDGVAAEVLLPGPKLVGVGSRVHRAWLKDYLRDPAAHRPGTRMPRQLGDTTADKAAEDAILAYLGSGQTAELAAAKPGGSSDEGKNLYKASGCATCHEPPEGTLERAGVPLRIPSLDRLAEKWTAGGLASFIALPLNTRAHGRMPNFGFNLDEAAHLTAYLLGREKAGRRPDYVALPKPKAEAKTDARAMIDMAGNLLMLNLDEPSGKLFDQSGNNHHGAVHGKLVYGQPGHSGSALRFDAKGGHLILEGSEKFNNNADFTWSAWIKTKRDGAIFGRSTARGGWPGGGKTLFVRSGKLCFDVGNIAVVTSKKSVNDDRWHHVAVTAKFNAKGANDRVVLYIDGKADAVKENWDINRFAEKNFVLKIGFCSNRFPQNHTFDGLIDDVSAWTRVLTVEELVALGRGESHLAATESALFTTEQLKAQWLALGEDARAFDKLGPGMRLKSVAIGQMTRLGCLNCHATTSPAQRRPAGSPKFKTAAKPAAAPSLQKLSPDRLSAGCLSGNPSPGKAPQFDLSAAERKALAAYVASLPLRNSPSPAETLSVDMKLLNCTACHEDEGYGGEPLVALLGGENSARFLRPSPLGGAAARMRPQRLDEYLRIGAGENRMRPWVGAKMPGFGKRGSRVARNLCGRDWVDAPAPNAKPPAPPENLPPRQLDMGRMLVSSKGLTCVTCHPINGRRHAGDLDPTIRAPDLGQVAAHVREEHFERMLRDARRIFPDTKMPVILPKGGPAPVRGLEKVPTDMLRRALWNYLSLGRKAPPPVEENPTVGLTNLLRVYVQRGPTFVGGRLYGRGISCGFNGGTLMYDADRLEPGAIWFQGFLNRVPTNYFGLNWRAPGGFQILSTEQHALAWQKADGRPWQVSPMPLECDPNKDSHFDGYTVGQSEIALRYRLAFDGKRLPVSDKLRIDFRDSWQGFVEELSIDPVVDGRIAWTVPKGQAYEFFAADGAKLESPGDPAAAPVVAFKAGKQYQAVRVEAPAGSAWLVEGETVRLVAPKLVRGKPLRLRIDRWLYKSGDRPSQADVASLCDAKLLAAPEKMAAAPKPTPAKRPAAPKVKAEPEEPFAYKMEHIPGPPEGWRPSGGVFTSDGWFYACGLTEGRVYRTRIPPVPVPEQIDWRLFASGLNVATGMNAIDDRLLVAHRPETTELIDRDGDGIADEYRTVTGPWSLKAGFHEYNFGLAVDPRKKIFSAMNNGYFWSYGGPTNRGRHRSAVMRYDLDGNVEEWGRGCRVPNGIACGPEGQAFYVDNQGDWIQACKLVHCRKGLFYGHPETKEEFVPDGEVPSGLPAIWLPYNVIRSAAALCYDDTGGKFGPFTGQMFTGDCGYGKSVNLMRIALEKVDGVFQGACFRFIDGKPRGPQHGVFGPDGHMYISCLTDGMMRVRWGGRVPMEIHRVNLRRDNKGFVLHFTEPIAKDAEVTPETIRARRWWYPYGIRYGSPRHEQVDVPIEKVEISADRKSIDVMLPIKTYKNCIVYKFDVGKLKSSDGDETVHPEAWYTIQRLWK